MSAHTRSMTELPGRRPRWFAGKGREYDVVDVDPRRHAARSARGDHRHPDRAVRRRRGRGGRRALPDAARALPRASRTGSGTPTSARRPTRSSARARLRRACTTARRWQVYLRTFAGTDARRSRSTYGGCVFHRLRRPRPRHRGALDAVQRRAEQLLGGLRRRQPAQGVPQGHPGPQPRHRDPRVLTESENGNVAALYGWIESAGRVHDLAMLQQFLRTASDGWDLALASARNLFAEADLHADEVGGDFAGEALPARRRGRRGPRRCCASTSTPRRTTRAALAAAMRERLAAAAAVVPELAEHTAALEAHLRRHRRPRGRAGPARPRRPAPRPDPAHLAGLEARRLRGRAAKELGERRLPDSPWRDVAGMLRSFDYAAAVGRQGPALARSSPARRSLPRRTSGPSATAPPSSRATSEQRVDAGGSPLTPAEQALIDAYEADKAVYEVVYEARNRPTWLDIPLSAIDRIGEHAMTRAHHRRDRPPPDQRGPPRAALGGPRRPRRRRPEAAASTVPRLGARRAWRSRSAATSTAGTAASTRCAVVGVSGVWEGFVPGHRLRRAATSSTIRGADGEWRDKADPMAFYTEVPPATASRVFESPHAWTDDEWMAERGHRPAHRPAADVGLRGAPRVVEAAPAPGLSLRRPRRAPRGVRRRDRASPTSSCCR